jgi:hypothetical protein
MPLASCVRCNKMFNKVKMSVCPGCEEAEEADQEKIRLVIEKDDTLNVEQVAIEADVDVSVVQRMVKEGSVTRVDLSLDVKCGKCGAPAISMSKKLCQACLDKLNTQVSKAQAGIKLGQKKDAQIGTYSARQTFEDKRK